MEHGEQRLRPVVLLTFLAAGLQLLRFAAPEYVIDDAYITFRVARSWVEAGVPTFDLTQPATESSTTTSWMLLAALFIKVFPGVDPMPPARVLGALLELLSLGLVLRLALQLADRLQRPRWQAALAAGVLFAANGALAYHALAGMETPLYALALLWSLDRALALEAEPSPRRGLLLGGALTLLFLTRPEGVLLAGVALAVLARRKTAWRGVAVAAAVAGACLAGLEAWRWLTYGALVPNTYFAKPPVLSEGLAYAGRYLLLGLGLLAPLATWPALRKSAEARWLVGTAALVLVSTAWSGGDWMPAFRRLVGVTVVLVPVVAAGLVAASGRARALAAVGVAAWLVADVGQAVSGSDGQMFNGEVSAKFGRVAQLSGLTSVAFGDVGSFSWHFRGSIFDPYGLTDRVIARQPGGYGDKAWDAAYFEQRKPQLVILRSFDKNLKPAGQPQTGVMRSDRHLADHVAQSPDYLFRARLRYAPNMVALFYVRRDVTLPARLWDQVPVPRLDEEAVPQ